MRSPLCRSLALSTLLLVLTTSPALALDMVVGDVSVQNLGDFGFDTQGTDNPGAETGFLSFDSAATDELFQMFGYLGTASGQVRVDSTNFTVSSGISQVGNTAVSQLTLSAIGAAALGLTTGAITVDYTFALIDDVSGADADALGWDIALTNTTASAIDVSFYSYLDLDLAGTFADDSAVANGSIMIVQDSVVPTSTFIWDVVDAAGADHFQVGDYPSVRTALNGMGSAQDLADTGGAFATGDFSAAYQFDRNIAAFATETIRMNTAIVPEPEPALLTGVGLVGLAFYGRRRPPLPRKRV